VRLFVAVWPPAPVIDELARIDRPTVPGTRWTAADAWHVTLRFLAEVPAAEPVVGALEQASLPSATARLGPSVSRLGRGVLCVPVSGLEALALAVTDATGGIGRPPERRPFRGHITLARTKASASAASAVAAAGAPAAPVGSVVEPMAWPVVSVVLVRSHLGRPSARYEPLAAFACR
jgi:2'-5' RNA ligase